jgi:hypothetical protein
MKTRPHEQFGQPIGSAEHEPTPEAKERFYVWVDSVAKAVNERAPKVPEHDRKLEPFEGIGYLEQIRPQKGDKAQTDNLFVCDFDDTVFDTTGYHEAIARRCSEFGISHEEWFQVYDQSKKAEEHETNPLYSRDEHIRALQANHPATADDIAQVFESEPLEPYLDQEVLAALNLAAAREDTQVMILTHGALRTQSKKLGQVPALAESATLIAYTQVPKKEFLEKYFASELAPERPQPISGGRYMEKRITRPHVFMLDDSPTEVSGFTSLGPDMYFQAMRLRLPRAKRFSKEQHGERVLESTDVQQEHYGRGIYSAFLGFVHDSTHFRPGQNFSQTTLGSTQHAAGGVPWANAEKCFAPEGDGEMVNWPAGYPDKSQRVRYNEDKIRLERFIGSTWQEYPLSELLDDREMIY